MHGNPLYLLRLFVILNLMLLIQSNLSQAATTQKRVALVIGNSAYQSTPLLANPRNDATEVGKVLKRIGFDVDVVVDTTKQEMDQALRQFGNKLDGASAAVFFYAGHGIQVDGINYILPVDVTLKNERDLHWEACDLTTVLKQMEGNNRVNLLFLDACRDNPLSQTLARSMGENRSAVIARGLAPMKASAGTLISYSTKEGEVAADGKGKHSPYTEALLKYIEMPGVEIGLMLRKVREEVITTTKKKQVPWEYGSLLGEFYFTEPVTVQVQPEADKTSDGSRFEALYWESIMNEIEPDVFEDYLKKYPNGAFREIAKRKIDKLSKVSTKPSLVDIVPQSEQKKSSGKIQITSDPILAVIYLDEEYVGMTPAEVVEVPDGTHTIVLKKDDFDEWTDAVMVKAGITVSVNALLTKVNGNNKPLVKGQNPIEPRLSVKAIPMDTQIGDQNQKNTPPTNADTTTVETVSAQTDGLKPDTINQPVPVKETLPTDQKPHADSPNKIAWSESKTGTEINGDKIPPGTLILNTSTGHSRKRVVGLKDGIAVGWNDCGKPAVWVCDGIRLNTWGVVQFAVLRDEAEKAGFYFNLSDKLKEEFRHYSYPNSMKKLRIDPGMTRKEALANEKCRRSPIDRK
jgi:hypothetical protein